PASSTAAAPHAAPAAPSAPSVAAKHKAPSPLDMPGAHPVAPGGAGVPARAAISLPVAPSVPAAEVAQQAPPSSSRPSSSRVRARIARLGSTRAGGPPPVLEPLFKIIRANHPK